MMCAYYTVLKCTLFIQNLQAGIMNVKSYY